MYDPFAGSGTTIEVSDLNDVTVSVRLSQAQAERLRQRAERFGISQSDVLRGFLDGEEIDFAALTVGWLSWIETSEPICRAVADAFQRANQGDIRSAVRRLKNAVEKTGATTDNPL